jgi:hypothetical protein
MHDRQPAPPMRILLALLAALAAVALPAHALDPCASVGPAQVCAYPDPDAFGVLASGDAAGVHAGSYVFAQPASAFLAVCANAEAGSGPGVFVFGGPTDGIGAGTFSGTPPC